MASDASNERRILESWSRNSVPWSVAVREGQIESRKQVTDQAVVTAILAHTPASVLDIGCGEGWLARELAARNIQVLGVDAIPALVEAAQNDGGGDFLTIAYEDIAAGRLKTSVDVAVCNFSLLGKESVEGIFKVMPSLLTPHGTFIIQTLHPVAACGDRPYRDGWREGSWAGFDADFTDPAPWYFRTIDSWVRLFLDNGLRLTAIREPLHPQTRKPASVIFISEPASR